ncbi:hypothetical protein Ddc_21403 [Ditylenchus destructor]|nr:hypothetical protein Ddc_21403 [Ditylenchus destructor]
MDEEKAKAECLLTVMELLGQKIELETAQEKAAGGNGEFKNQFILARQLTKHDCSQEREAILDLSNAPDVVLMKTLLKKLGRHLKVVVLDMILNNCPHCTEYAYTLYECVENKRCFDVYSNQMNDDPQLVLENFLSVSEYDSRFRIDDEFVDIFRDMPNLKWLNLFNVEISNNCLIRLAESVSDRLEALVLGCHKRDGIPQSITSLLPELFSKFTSLRYFALPPCENGYCDPRAVISCLPSTITHLDLYGDRPISIDSAVGKLAEITPHLKFLSINVHSSVDMAQLNRVAKKLET